MGLGLFKRAVHCVLNLRCIYCFSVKKDFHEKYMKLALNEAFKARGNTFPNPAVGAILVKNGKVLSRGHTQPPGGAHAEVMALKKAGLAAKGAHLFVTLEPCNHYGRTPPCSLAIIKAGVKKVSYGFLDPNPKVKAKGIARLKKAGIDCSLENLNGQLDEFYGDYAFFVKYKRPKIILKVAQSLEGAISAKAGTRSQISSPELAKWTHKLRQNCDGILVGAATIKADKPLLNIRYGIKKRLHEPWILILGQNSRRKIPGYLKQMAKIRKLMVFDREDPRPIADQNNPALCWEPLKYKAKNPVREVVEKLSQKGFHSILVEGGAKTLQFWLDSGLWDEFYILQSPVTLPGGLLWAQGKAKNWDKGAKIGKFMPFKNEVIWCFVPKISR